MRFEIEEARNWYGRRRWYGKLVAENNEVLYTSETYNDWRSAKDTCIAICDSIGPDTEIIVKHGPLVA